MVAVEADDPAAVCVLDVVGVAGRRRPRAAKPATALGSGRASRWRRSRRDWRVQAHSWCGHLVVSRVLMGRGAGATIHALHGHAAPELAPWGRSGRLATTAEGMLDAVDARAVLRLDRGGRRDAGEEGRAGRRASASIRSSCESARPRSTRTTRPRTHVSTQSVNDFGSNAAIRDMAKGLHLFFNYTRQCDSLRNMKKIGGRSIDLNQ